MPEGFHLPKPQDHLNLNIKGARPIMACVGTHDDFWKARDPEDPASYFYEQFKPGVKNVTYVDWHFANIHNGGAVASLVDSSNKMTEGLADCTSLIVTGIEKRNDGVIRNISFLTHQDPKEFLCDTKYGGKKKFVSFLRSLLVQIKQRCEIGTIDAVLIGGNYVDGVDFLGNVLSKQDYIDSVKLIGVEAKRILHFEPVVINGPHMTYQDDIYYDNEHRRLYFVRPKVNSKIGDFPASDVDNQKDKFK